MIRMLTTIALFLAIGIFLLPASRAQNKNGNGKKGVAAYRAEQKGKKLTVYAEGMNNTGGWTNKIEALRKDAKPPEFKFTQTRPTGPATQAFVRFSVKDTIDAPEKVEEVIVHDALGKHKVRVNAPGGNGQD